MTLLLSHSFRERPKAVRKKQGPSFREPAAQIRKCGTKSPFPKHMESSIRTWQGIIWKTTSLLRICRTCNSSRCQKTWHGNTMLCWGNCSFIHGIPQKLRIDFSHTDIPNPPARLSPCRGFAAGRKSFLSVGRYRTALEQRKRYVDICAHGSCLNASFPLELCTVTSKKDTNSRIVAKTKDTH